MLPSRSHRHVCRTYLVALLLVALVVFAGPATPMRALAPNAPVVISQIYGGGGNSGAPFANDYVELFNRSAASVSLDGWSIQYASATGPGVFADNPMATLSGSLASGQYYLIQLSGGASGVALPTPDASGAINASATAGKVVLVTSSSGLNCNGGSTPCTAEQTAFILDLVGYGSANFFEGAGPAPTLNNTSAALRAGGGCTDTNSNSADFAASVPAPRNSASPRAPCGGDPPPTAPSITTQPQSRTIAAGQTASLSVVATGSAPLSYQWYTGDSGDPVSPIDGATASSYTTPALAAGSYRYWVRVSNNAGSADSQTATLTVMSGPPITSIGQVQGSGPASPLAGQSVTVEALVIGDYQAASELRGFFLQEEETDADGDPDTSEGLFVFCNSCPLDVALGDQVRVTGSVSEFFAMSQITASTAGSITILSRNNPLPTPASLSMPVPGVTGADLATARPQIDAYFEAFEGMLVRFPATLTIAEQFELARYGQLVLSADGRPRQFTDQSLPDAAGYARHLVDVARRTIILDDLNNTQNSAIASGTNQPYFWPRPGLSTGNFFRGGDTITNLTGVLHWSFAGQSGTDAWRIRPVEPAFSYAFTSANPRPAPPVVSGSLRVAAANVLNYFLTIDSTASSTVGSCGPSRTADCRGPDSAAESLRQREKLTQALLALNADVVGLVELENTPAVTPTLQIVRDLNAAGPASYSVIDSGLIGSDAIRVGMLYQPARVTPVGDFAVLDASVDPEFDSSRNRPALAQSFRENASGELFTVVVVHLKSKGDSGLGGAGGVCSVQGPGANPNCDQNDGQGYWNASRTRAAAALARWLASDPTGVGAPDYLIVGDLNAYRNEDPIRALEAAGFVDLVDRLRGPDAYSYVFDGQPGYLDYALASPSLATRVTGVSEWHINADEPVLFDYNDSLQDPGEASFERKSNALPLYAADAFRVSDHDPLLVGLNLAGADPRLYLPLLAR
ncbi:MAG: ExeM/NucH family extracellular endonuclease [Chloroflexi bacterium]|nr:ExeM/NucH family extracellular endonuclease [Chloroflexota bacterium]